MFSRHANEFGIRRRHEVPSSRKGDARGSGVESLDRDTEQTCPVFEAIGVDVRYGGVIRALEHVTLRVEAGQIVVLVGRNGGGKSTLLRAISGLLPYYGGSLTAGSLNFLGQPLDGCNAADRVGMGIAQVMEGRRIFVDLSVGENLRLGAFSKRHDKAFCATALDRVFTLFPVLAARRNDVAGYLSGGEQQMLAIGRAMLSDPKLLLLDEPTLGLAPLAVDKIADALRTINASGTPVLLVEQNAGMALELADVVYALDTGSVVELENSGSLAELGKIYMGSQTADRSPEQSEPASARPMDRLRTDVVPVLQVRDLSLTFGGVSALTDVSFDVHAGETLAIIGPNGAGKSSLLNCVTGSYKPVQGTVQFRGRHLVGMAPNQITSLGLGRSFQNLGVVGSMTVLQNIMLGRHSHIQGGFLSTSIGLPGTRRSEQSALEWSTTLLENLGLFDRRNEAVALLPYGLQKLVDLGRALALAPSILILDEPIAGMSQEERQEILELLRGLRTVVDNEDLAIVLVEHDMDFVMSLADRVVVMDFGRKIAQGTPSSIRENQDVIRAYLGSASPGGDGAGR
jgi:ABC-type branched-subunit amino acid transport system ATPase component